MSLWLVRSCPFVPRLRKDSPLSGCCRVLEEPSYLTRAATELREGWPALAARRYSAMSSELSGAAKD
eukprot:SAG31_NODE_3851_length_3817_cov_89.532544_3_plen_67_part_00